MATPENLLEISSYGGEGYFPLVDYASWRVAVLRYIDELLPEMITKMQRHDETDEVFVLLQGRCILFLGEGDKTISNLHAEDMQPLKIYNVKRSAWHNHSLSKDALVLIVENLDTDDGNSPSIDLTPAQHEQLIALAQSLLPANG
jgi:hypothetical protein